jgi:hypothetical protein
MAVATEELDAQVVCEDHIALPQSHLVGGDCKSVNGVRQPLRVTVNRVFFEGSRHRKEHLDNDAEDLDCEFNHLFRAGFVGIALDLGKPKGRLFSIPLE